MYRRGSLVFRILGVLVLIGILVAAGTLIYQAGQAQGYALGVATGGNDPSTGTPSTPVYPGYGPGYWPGFYRPFFFPFGPLLGLFFWGGLFFLFFFGIGGLFRRGWRQHGPYAEN